MDKQAEQSSTEVRKYLDQLAGASTRIQYLVGKIDDYVAEHDVICINDIDGEPVALAAPIQRPAASTADIDRLASKLVEKFTAELKAKDAEIDRLQKELESVKKAKADLEAERSTRSEVPVRSGLRDHARGSYGLGDRKLFRP
ncbi:hypothetical protein TWF696_000798 [Orbilia brochopaga]|uniref:Uncharacterized protein n=1 Tax=Orbilia brochopaga TaxID=3140254 RepID=A0AAV9VF41_9PEZI